MLAIFTPWGMTQHRTAVVSEARMEFLEALQSNPAALQGLLATLSQEQLHLVGLGPAPTPAIVPVDPAPVPPVPAPAAGAPRGRRRARGAEDVSGPEVSLDDVLRGLWLFALPEDQRIRKKRFHHALVYASQRVHIEQPEQQVLSAALATTASQGADEPSRLTNSNSTARKYKRELAETLHQAGIERPPIPSVDGVSLREVESSMGVVDIDGEDDPNDSSGSAPEDPPNEEGMQAVHDAFMSFSPTEPTPDDAIEIHSAYGLITHPTNGFRAAIFFDVVPVLRRVYANVRTGQANVALSSRATLDPKDTQLMLGGGRCQSQKT
eukprot:scaffold107653_cov63-Phaeocystis_antarctica.AAC.1